ncbi:MAG TPA: LCP family protein [Acidimicrobiia bacterium]
MAAYLSAARTFALRFTIALVVSFMALYGALWAADRVAATKISEATQLKFRPGSLHDTGQADSPGEPANFVIVGSDTRSFVHSSVDVSHFGSATQDPGARSDTLMIAHIDPNSKQALIVSFPRDLYVTLPGGCRQKINAAYNQDFKCHGHSGGPQDIVDTLKQNFNIDINHYVEVNFAGFRQMVDVLGTVPIYFPAKARDTYTGLDVNGGCQNLTGIESLDYVRSRHYQYFDYATQEWVKQGQSDLARIQRQQYFIRTLMQTAIDQGAHDVLTAYNFADKMVSSLALDSKFSLNDLKRLINTFRLTQPGAVQMLTVPTVTNGDGLALASNAESVLAQLRSFTPAPPAPPKFSFKPSQVKVEVRDASGAASSTTSGSDTSTTTSGTTGADWVTNRASSLLGAAGFPVAIGPVAPESQATILQFTEKTKGQALVLVSHMNKAPKLQEVANIRGGADLVLLVGHAGSGLIDPNAPATTTTTTAPPAGGTTTTTILPNPGTPPAGTPASSVKSQWIGCQ